MKRTILIICVATLLCACSRTPKASISAVVDGVADTIVVLQRLNINKLMVVDTIKTDSEGAFDYTVKLPETSPAFYYLYFGERQIAAMILLPGDKVKVSAKSEGGWYDVEGSEESSLLNEVNTRMAADYMSLDSLASLALAAEDETELKSLHRQMGELYVKHKREAIRHIFNNPHSITTATILFEKFNENLPVFGEASDALLFQRVYDTLSVVYPKSDLLVPILDKVTARQNELEMSSKVASINMISFPELSLPDIDGNEQVLSRLEGNPFILMFWSVGQTEHKMFNNDLVELYGKYHGQGLEIYQVSLDIDKSEWASAVRTQALPWINVNDGLGVQSPAVAAYNISAIPSMFVFDKSGELVGRDVYDSAKLESLIKSSL